jgi:ATP-dependent exoDNAse (exonuclease V) beta subunit
MAKLGDSDTDRDGTIELIAEWRHDKMSKAQKNGQQVITDMANCMEVFATYGETLGQAIAYAEHLFDQQGSIKLMTGHKSKGLEYDTVYHLDPGLIRDGNDEQEKNLRFVITTRAKQELYEINSETIAWSQPQAD